jgi:hypothetical protein
MMEASCAARRVRRSDAAGARCRGIKRRRTPAGGCKRQLKASRGARENTAAAGDGATGISGLSASGFTHRVSGNGSSVG